MDPEVEQCLVEIFYHVADAIDGGENVPEHLRTVYYSALHNKKFQKFYDAAVKDAALSLSVV